jgi:Gpi18-like mannosyltransferase
MTAALRPRLAIAALAFVVWTAFAAWHAQVKPADFYVFWAAARHWPAPYDPAVIAQLEASLHITGAWPFVYPPTFLLIAWPFGLAPLAVAYPLWTGLTSALFFFAASFTIRPVWASLLLFILPPVVLAVAPGQTSLLVGAAAIGGFLLIEKRPALAGVLFALAACIKPQAMILAPIVLWGHWRVMRWAAIAGLGMILASFVFGPGLWPQWLHAIGDFRAVAPATERVNPSALSASPLWTAALAALGLYLAWTNRNLLGLVGGALCLTPYAHQYDLAALTPLALMWLIDRKRLGWGHAVAGAALLAGAVATPAMALAFLLALAVFSSRWWPYRGQAASAAFARPYEA